jgi:pimeloyl-ACP methyl ester carboxylesterase
VPDKKKRSHVLPLTRLPDEEVERLLASGERAEELRAWFGDEGYRELSSLARRAAQTRHRGGPPTYVLPGLMGSRIGTRGRLLDDVLWVDLVEIAAGHLTRLALPRGARLTALGALLLNALKLKLSLQIAGFDARFRAYDWRLGIEPLATALNARIAAEDQRDVLLVGHSMGGLVARVALAGDHGRIARVVQVGSPNCGSFAPVLALRGVYPTVRKIAALDRHHSAEDLARIIFRTLPALHELLPDPTLADSLDLFDADSWPDDELRPDATLLGHAREAKRLWPDADPRCLHIIGIRQETVTAVRRRGNGFDYVLTSDGDGTVPTALAEVPGARAWYAVEKHGGLPNNGKVISAVVDLLRDGTTERLPSSTRRAARARRRIVTEPVLRRVATHKVRWQDLSPDARRRLLEPVVSPEFHGAVAPETLQSPAQVPTVQAERPRVVEIRLAQASITDANARALVLGVYRNVEPSGAAAAIDERLGGAIREFALRRMYSGALGQVFVLPALRSPLMADMVLLAGLGEFDDFGADAQEFVTENIVRTFVRARVEDFATVLFGGSSGVHVARALEHQLRGYLNGLRLADAEHVVRRITFCEIDPRKYQAMRRAIEAVARDLAGQELQLIVDEALLPQPVAHAGKPPATRVARPSRPDPAYLLLNVTSKRPGDLECRASLLTAGAKAAVLSGTVSIEGKRLEAHLGRLESGSLSARDLAKFGDKLAALMLSPSVLEGLEQMRSRPLIVVHDREASRVPWETLRVGDGFPALHRGLSRRYTSESLTVARWREDRALGERIKLLLVVDPTEDLPGAAREGEVLGALLRDAGARVQLLQGSGARRQEVLAALAGGSFDVLHFAGHGFFDRAEPGRSGLLCADGAVLRGADLDGIGNLPALVFFNACEAARVRRPGRRKLPVTRQFRASPSLAEAFLSGGVANFIGTHWPVGDDAALTFSSRFYARLLAGDELGAATLAARLAVHARGSLDWADYVHYGNPWFTLDSAQDNPREPSAD